jgi:hypothetical protein
MFVNENVDWCELFQCHVIMWSVMWSRSIFGWTFARFAHLTYLDFHRDFHTFKR